MRNTQTGVTLLELMMVVAVISILAAIAYPSYQDQVLKSHRTEGKAALMEAAQQMERCYTRTNTFAGCVASFATRHGRYQIAAPTATATAFSLSATPLGGQLKDTRCGVLTYDHLQVRGEAGTGTVADCW